MQNRAYFFRCGDELSINDYVIEFIPMTDLFTRSGHSISNCLLTISPPTEPIFENLQ